MAGETGPTAELASRLSKEVFKWFRWERIPLIDRNFSCSKKERHAPRKNGEHTHPVDVIFHYLDPYLNKRVILNTDLKSYARDSITSSEVKKALKSLAQTIECARVSPAWKAKYQIMAEQVEVRGFLFVYNHDADYDKDFFKIFDKPKDQKPNEKNLPKIAPEKLPLVEGMQIHIADPRLINYLTTILTDVNKLIAEGSFPKSNYYFHYPELKLHKTSGDKKSRPATIEMISGPFFIVEHAEVHAHNDAGAVDSTFPAGYVVFYNRPGKSAQEFIYFFDTLSNYQMLDGDASIRIRLAHHMPDANAISHFNSAIELYIQEWGFDKYKRERLTAISLEIIDVQKRSYSDAVLGWERL